MPKNAQTTAQLHSSHTLVMFKILQARLQQYVNHELPDVQAGFRKGRGARDQIANRHYIIEKAREFHKNIYLCFIDYAKAFDCVDHSKLWKIQTHKLLLENSSNIIDTSLNLSFLLLENWRWLPDCSASLMGYQ